MSVDVLAAFTPEMVRELAISQRVCVRPLLRRVEDRQTGTEDVIALPCGSTRESVCPPCAHKARVLRMQQCAEGWHRGDEPTTDCDELEADRAEPEDHTEEQDDDEKDDDMQGARRVRSTRRRQDAPDLPRVALEDRTVGRTFTAPDGTVYRPSMFLTVTLGSYGPVTPAGAPRDPESYDYRRAALDALHFPKLIDRLWRNLRRCAGYRVQYFAAVEPQRRLAPHLHAAIRGAIPRAVLREVVRATYLQLWWPAFDTPVYVDRLPVWDSGDYVDPVTGEILPTWTQARDQAEAVPEARPAHVLRFGMQLDMAGTIAPSADADRAVRYLTKYLTKSVAAAHVGDDDQPDPTYRRHVDRLHAELRWLPCLPRCANWLVTASNPTTPAPDLSPPTVTGRRMIGRTSVSAAAGCWCRGNGPARPSAHIGPTGPPSSAKRCSPPASSPRRSSVWPPPSPWPTGHPGSSGPTADPPRAATSGCCSPRSRSGNAGGPSTRPRRPPLPLLWTTHSAIPAGHRDCEHPPHRIACWRGDHTRPPRDQPNRGRRSGGQW